MHDVEFFDNLAEANGFYKIQAASCGFVTGAGRDGISHLKSALDALPSIPGFSNLEAILIVADNDSDPATSFANVQRLINATADIEPNRRYVAPNAPLTKGGENPIIVVMMIPWTGIMGALDTICLEAASLKRPAIATSVNAFAQSIGVDGAHGWPITKQDKMKLRSLISAAYMTDPYLAPTWVWRDKTDLVPLSDHQVFDQITNFLRNFPAFLAAP